VVGSVLNGSAAIDRARNVAIHDLGWSGEVIAVQLGESNDVWFAGPAVLRIAPTPGRSNLIVEARVVNALPAAVGYPVVLGSGVWDGRHAIPVDFEFATLALDDLDVENLARSITALSPDLLRVIAGCLTHRLRTPGATERIRAYAVLRETWALHKWIANWPERRNIHAWEPTRRLRAIADGTSWVTPLLSGEFRRP